MQRQSLSVEFLRVMLSALTVSWLFLSPLVSGALPTCNFKAIYNFGDSNSDTGGIYAAFGQTTAPYGQSFFHRPASRASDGRLLIDFIAERLNLPYLSAYLNSIGTSFRHGANFATGGSTIRAISRTGISPFPLDTQIGQFDQFKSRTADLYGCVWNTSEAEKLPRSEDFPDALYTFDIGQNDLSVGFATMSTDQLLQTLPHIIGQLATAIQHLYHGGGRVFWVHGIGPLGCLPVNFFNFSNPPEGYLDEHGCFKTQNDASVEFNRQLKHRLAQLRADLPEAAITYVDIYAAKYGLISNAAKERFTDPLKACCGFHQSFADVGCGKTMVINGKAIYGGVCENPAAAVSWDGVHYTEAANKWVAEHTQNGLFTDPSTPITQACHRR